MSYDEKCNESFKSQRFKNHATRVFVEKLASLIIVFMFVVSQTGFCDDLINSPVSKKRVIQPVEQKGPIRVESRKVKDKPAPPVIVEKKVQEVKTPEKVEIKEVKKIEKPHPAKSATAKFDRLTKAKRKSMKKVKVVKETKKIEKTQPAKFDRRPAKVDKVDSSRFGSNLIGFGSSGTWQIHPGFEFRTTYDSNVNREPPHKRDEDIIFNYIPSVEISRRGTNFEVLGGYEMNYQQFLRNPNQSGFNHTVKTGIKYHRHRLKANLDENFTWAKAYASSEQSERRTIVVNDVQLEIAYRATSKFSFASLYRNYHFQYKESAFRENSYNKHEIGGRIYYHATSKLDFYVHSTANITEYFNSGTFDSHGISILLGSKGRLSKKVLVDVATGYKGQRYQDPTINSFDDWVVQGNIQYRMTPKMSIALSAKRDREESVYRHSAFFRSNGVALNLSYKVSSHITASIDGGIQNNAYPVETTEGTRTKKRNDMLFNASAKLNWKPARYLTFSLGYNFRERASNFDNLFDYVDHSVDSSVSCKF